MKKEISLRKVMLNILIIQILLDNIILIPGIIFSILRYLFIILGIIRIFFGDLKLKKTMFSYFIYLYCFFMIISWLLGSNMSIDILLSTIQFIIILNLIISISSEDIRYVLDTFFNILHKIIIIAICYSFLIKLFGDIVYSSNVYINSLFFPFIKQYAFGLSGDLGYSSFYNNSNIFGFFILLVLTTYVFRKWNKKSIYTIILLMVGIILSNSRAIEGLSILLLFLKMYMWAKEKFSKKTNYILKVILIAPILCVFLILVVLFNNTIVDFISSIDLAGRAEMWNMMIESIKINPAFGIGFSASSKFLLSNFASHMRVGSHSSYLNILAENGVVGFTVFILMNMYLIYQICKKSRNKLQKNDYLFRVSVTIFFLYIPYALVENAYMLVEMRSYIWLIIAVYIENECLHYKS